MLTITNYISSACLTKSKSLVFVGPPAVELILSLPTEPHGKNNRGGFWPPQVWLGQILQLNFPSFPFGVGLGGLVVVGGKWGEVPIFQRVTLGQRTPGSGISWDQLEAQVGQKWVPLPTETKD